MDLAQVRRLVIIAVCSDDLLMDKLVLKGGNALALVHNIGFRASVDVDFSMEGDFDDLEDTSKRLERALIDRFDSNGFVLFDFHLKQKPLMPAPDPDWGGYMVDFKLIEKLKHQKFSGDIVALRRNSFPIDAFQKRNFKVDISKNEYCVGKVLENMDDYSFYVYTPAMIVLEKIRAICQQMPDYSLRGHKKARARDFYDIYTTVSSTGLDVCSVDNLHTLREMFARKSVPLEYISRIKDQKDFHQVDWPAVRDTIKQDLKDFGIYFEFVVGLAAKLESTWKA